MTEERALTDIWRFDILTLLEEYYFGEFERLQREIFEVDHSPLFNERTQDIGDFGPETLRDTLTELVMQNLDVVGATGTDSTQ